MRKSLIPALFLLLAACGSAEPESTASDETAASAPAPTPAPEPRPTPEPAPPQAAEPIPPGQPGGLPDDRTPISEVPFAPGSAQGAANVVQTYYALIEAGKYAEAWALWHDGGEAAGGTQAAFAKRFAGFREYHAQIGAPQAIEGGAGSLYVSVPVQAYGRRADGQKFNALGTVKLRRVNDVPGATEEQRRWRIMGVEPAGPYLR